MNEGYWDDLCFSNDPGVFFPWRTLAQNKIGLWPPSPAPTVSQMPFNPSAVIRNQHQLLKQIGYRVGIQQASSAVAEYYNSSLRHFQWRFCRNATNWSWLPTDAAKVYNGLEVMKFVYHDSYQKSYNRCAGSWPVNPSPSPSQSSVLTTMKSTSVMKTTKNAQKSSSSTASTQAKSVHTTTNAPIQTTTVATTHTTTAGSTRWICHSNCLHIMIIINFLANFVSNLWVEKWKSIDDFGMGSVNQTFKLYIKLQGVPKLLPFYSIWLTPPPRGVERCMIAHFVANYDWFCTYWTDICIMTPKLINRYAFEIIGKCRMPAIRDL